MKIYGECRLPENDGGCSGRRQEPNVEGKYLCTWEARCGWRSARKISEAPEEKKVVPPPARFWMVQRIDDLGKPAVRKHGTLDIARREAERLAKTCGGRYAVLEAVEFVEAVAVKMAPQECTAKAQD